jgi:hypothetical protein
MTLVDNYFPFDTGAGQTATLTRWRLMGRLFVGSGVIPGYLSQFATTLAGGVATIQPGAAWIDGFYGESDANKTVTVSGAGMIVGQMDPVNKYIRFVFQPGASYSPAQSPTGIFEIPLYTVSGTTTLTLADARQFALADPNKVARCRVYRTATYPTSTAWTSYGFNAPAPAPAGWNGSVYTVPYAADYLVIAQAGFGSTAVGQWYNIQLIHNGAVDAWAGTTNASAVGAFMLVQVQDIISCKTGDTIGLQHRCSTVIANGGEYGSQNAFMNIRAMS